ncbi:hypothetical protein BDR26DRAFT_580082 [Obelidium mucronatum]|nr:hypothetical protein BDR26DRAFT_580082 [Obelidium mucronatum]
MHDRESCNSDTPRSSFSTTSSTASRRSSIALWSPSLPTLKEGVPTLTRNSADAFSPPNSHQSLSSRSASVSSGASDATESTPRFSTEFLGGPMIERETKKIVSDGDCINWLMEIRTKEEEQFEGDDSEKLDAELAGLGITLQQHQVAGRATPQLKTRLRRGSVDSEDEKPLAQSKHAVAFWAMGTRKGLIWNYSTSIHCWPSNTMDALRTSKAVPIDYPFAHVRDDDRRRTGARPWQRRGVLLRKMYN